MSGEQSVADAELISKFFAKRVVKSAKRGAVNEAELAARIQEVELETQILGASFLSVHIIDPELTLTNSGWLEVKEGLLDAIEVEFPEGSKWMWTLCACEISTQVGANLEVKFESSLVKKMREYWGPKQAPPGTRTRAQFVRDLLSEAGIRSVIPGLNVIQPLEEEEKDELGTAIVKSGIEQSKAEEQVNKTKGVGHGAAVTIKGQKPTPDQLALINQVTKLADKGNAGSLATEALLEACIQENDFSENGEGLLQFLASTASSLGIQKGDVEAEVVAFLTRSYSAGTSEVGSGGAIEYAKKRPNATADQVAQAAQGSAYPEAYGQWAQEAKNILNATGGTTLGGTSAATTGESDVSQLTRGTPGNPDEDTFEAINRLASQVDWFAFTYQVPGHPETMFYEDGPELAKQKPSAYIDIQENYLINAHTGRKEYGVVSMPTVGTIDNCLALNTPIPTPDGWTTMGELEPGDMVLGADGRPTRVRLISDVHADRTCYRVRFNDDTSIVADAGHLWETQLTWPNVPEHERVGIRTTEEIRETLRWHARDYRLNHRVRVVAPLELPEKDLPLDPYVFGYWLGDGHSAAPSITADEEDLPSLEREIERSGYSHITRWHAGTGYSKGKQYPLVTFSLQPEYRKSRAGEDSVLCRLRALNVLGSKHIPACYLRASYGQRLALLQGIMDSDGTVDRRCEITLADERLAGDVLELIHTLGFRVHCRSKPARNGSRPQFAMGFAARDHLAPFRLRRKAERYAECVNTATRSRCAHRTITDVEPVESVPVKCVEVEAADHLFLAGESMIPTRNTTYEYRRTHKVKTRVQRRSKASKPSTPSEVRLELICAIDDYRAGDVFVIRGFGPCNGRWIISDATRNCLKDTFTKFILEPPVEPLPEPLATSKGAELTGEGSSTVADEAKKALAEQKATHPYKYVYGAGHQAGFKLFGQAPRECDCSAFAGACYREAGAPVPGQSSSTLPATNEMIAAMKKTSTPEPGDLCFFGSSETDTTHVTVYVGGGMAISMGQEGDPEEGPYKTTGPSGFLGVWAP